MFIQIIQQIVVNTCYHVVGKASTRRDKRQSEKDDERHSERVDERQSERRDERQSEKGISDSLRRRTSDNLRVRTSDNLRTETRLGDSRAIENNIFELFALFAFRCIALWFVFTFICDLFPSMFNTYTFGTFFVAFSIFIQHMSCACVEHFLHRLHLGTWH